MKKVIIALLIVLAAYLYFSNDVPDLEKNIPLNDHSVYSGELLLINKETKLEQDPTELAVIPADIANNVLVESEYMLQQDVIEPLQRMFEAAEKNGIKHYKINSAYRSGDLQQQLYAENGATYALPAGYSEHQAGLALDIGSTQGTMDQTAEGEWLAENAAKFGFILRYPENKVDVTGIAFEPWHFRYVGLPHSLIMDKKDLALEEYIDFIKEEKAYAKTINGVKYVVQYAEQTDTAKIPNTTQFDISGDNVEGFIITSIVD